MLLLKNKLFHSHIIFVVSFLLLIALMGLFSDPQGDASILSFMFFVWMSFHISSKSLGWNSHLLTFVIYSVGFNIIFTEIIIIEDMTLQPDQWILLKTAFVISIAGLISILLAKLRDSRYKLYRN
jgi:hypothetical protein